MTRHSIHLTSLIETGPVFKQGRHYIDANENLLHGIYHADQETTAHTIVFIQGVLVADYAYPRIDSMFSSPMINDFNLHFVGRWRWPFENEGEALVKRIAGREKPAGLIALPKEHGPALLQAARDAGLAVVFQDDDARGVQYLGFSIWERFKDVFDLGSIVADYAAYEQATRFLPDNLESTIESMLFRIENDTIMSRVERYLSMNPEDVVNIITSGLVFGYPIQTTVAFLAGTIS